MTATVPPIHRLQRRRGLPPWIWAIAVILVLGVMLLALAPSSKAGSSFDRSPWGSREFFDYLNQQGFHVKRWQRDYTHLEGDGGDVFIQIGNNQTLPDLLSIDGPTNDWLEQGNTLLRLAWGGKVTAGPFSPRFATDQGPVQVNTRRRFINTHPPTTPAETTYYLEDAQGRIIALEQGRILVLYPWLVANAYNQPDLGNYAFVAHLLEQAGARTKTIWFDEWLHGYRIRDSSDLPEDVPYQDFIDYLSQTPWLGIFFQGILIFLFLLWQHNHRFGPLLIPSPPEVNNSLDYIQAMAGVLHRAEQTDFVLNQLRDRLRYDVAYGLGMTADSSLGRYLPEDGELVSQWAAETGRDGQDLQQLLQPKDQNQPMRPQELLAWLGKAESVVRGRR
ncbi:DUF4350 domain-containing protein [Candidatus Synechococcus calcipolaris G9]|uniref:DUF4350 domain-containing protein n=1 Tax=Candidatus Synechococcus calcipolaris G9 TaxID=1497997 RepID=A0ABT6F0F7_9SYNE|nr:DUF4350 domain-containing protein [Candidatus Synechococcus calcipolaris]MDG2991304.1 DUF4350 domain-containing protein [Candidatus Synechococcus calcipolaris G9]